MTHPELIEHVRNAYLNARECVYTPLNHPTILARGTSRPISSLTEDLVGSYCADRAKDPAHNRVLVEPALSFKSSGLKNLSGKSALLIKPDVVLLRDNQARVFLDIKTDLGHKRKDMLEKATEQEELLKTIKGKKVHFKDGRTKNDQILTIADNIRLLYVVICEGNIGKADLEGHIKHIQGLQNIGMLVLTTGDHLNSYHANPRWDLHEQDLAKLDAVIDEAFRA